MKLDLIPFSPIMPPPDLMLALRNPQFLLVAGGIILALIAAWLLFVPSNRKARVARLGGLTWKRNQFCRGWLITGDTGSGKTSSGINQLAHQVFQNEPKWGGLCIDEKGVYWETLAAMARHYGREHDLVHLQIRKDDTDTQWTPPNRYNLTGDRSIGSNGNKTVRLTSRYSRGAPVAGIVETTILALPSFTANGSTPRASCPCKLWIVHSTR